MKITIKGNERILKALEFNKIKKYSQLELPDIRFVREFLEDWTGYLNQTINAVIKGVVKKTGLNVEKLKLKSRVRIKKQNKELLLKGLYEQILPYINEIEGLVGRKSPEDLNKPIKIKGRWVLNPETGLPLTFGQWQDITDSIINFMGSSFDGLNEELAVKGFALANILKIMEDQGIPLDKIKKMSYKEVEQKYYGKKGFPKTIKQAKTRIKDYDEYSQQSIEYSMQNAGKYLSLPFGEIATNTVQMVRNQVTFAIQNKLSAKELASNLYHQTKEMIKEGMPKETYESLVRNNRRIARTEMSNSINNGFISSYTSDVEKGEDVYMVYSGRYNPKEKPNEICNCFLGEIVKVITPKQAALLGGKDTIKDKYAKRAIWIGKNRVGKGKSNVWIAISSHPECTHKWNRIIPEIQKYSQKFQRPVYKKNEEGEFAKKYKQISESKEMQEFEKETARKVEEERLKREEESK